MIKKALEQVLSDKGIKNLVEYKKPIEYRILYSMPGNPRLFPHLKEFCDCFGLKVNTWYKKQENHEGYLFNYNGVDVWRLKA